MFLRLGSIGLLLYSFAIVRSAMPTLPPRIPVHFNAAGRADGWGDPSMLWYLFCLQTGLTALFFAIPLISKFFPNAGHIGRHRMREFSAAQQVEVGRVIRRLFDIVALTVNGVFVYICRGTIEAARTPGTALRPLPIFLMMGVCGAAAIYSAVKLMQFVPQAASSSTPAAANQPSSPPPIVP